MSVAILISLGSVDGYPPVQYQAKLLAYAGLQVEVLTLPLNPDQSSVNFEHPEVRVHCVPFIGFGGLGTVHRITSLAGRLCALRLRHRRRSTLFEIAYDPMGMALSDLVPFKPKLRIAHFHEYLGLIDTQWYERRLKRTIRNYQAIVVADAERGQLTKEQLRLIEDPIVVPNYPMRIDSMPIEFELASRAEPIEVVYAGSFGKNQMLEFIISSVPFWPEDTTLVLLGKDWTSEARALKQMVNCLGLENRVRFDGWVDFQDLPARLARASLGISLLDASTTQMRTALQASNKRYLYMQAGLPQIGDTNPGVIELIEGNNIGTCLRRNDPKELADLVQIYAMDGNRRKVEGARAKELHHSTYHYELAFQPVLNWLHARDFQVAEAQ